MLSLLDKFHTLESCVKNNNQKLNETMRALEQNTGLEIQILQKAVVKRFAKTEEIIRTDEQGDKVQVQNLALPVQVKVRNDLPRVLTVYPAISSEKPTGTKYPKVVKEYKWKLIGMRELKELKQATVILRLALTSYLKGCTHQLLGK